MTNIRPSQKTKKINVKTLNEVESLLSPSYLPIVAIGASAGGLEATTELITHLPTDTGMAFILIEHMDPKQSSQMVEILSRSTSMPVIEVKNGERVLANHFYVISPNLQFILSHDILKVVPRSKNKSQKLSIDSFFQSLAQEKKTKAIGIILSGTASDGTNGLRFIKSEGGITFAQDPKSAAYGGMPRNAIAAGVVDLILTPKEISIELSRIAKHPYSEMMVEGTHNGEDLKDSPPNEIIQGIFVLLRNHTRVDFTHYKSTTIKRRIQRQMMLHKVESIEGYAEYLKVRPEALDELCEDIFIHVTGFFRDSDSFQALNEHVFQRLIIEKLGTDPIRIWVPGCSTGEEAYSIAMSLFEQLENQSSRITFQIFATDISEKAIKKARVGLYSEQQVQDLSKERLNQFFDKVKDGYKIKKLVRDVCIFSRHDLVNNPPFSKLDLISCRNVLIYFGPVLQKRVVPIFHYALKPGGFLWLGKSEVPSSFSKLFTLIDKSNKIFSKINTASHMSFQFPTASGISEKQGQSEASFKHQSNILGFNHADQIVLSNYAPAGVIVNSDMEILQFRGKIVPYLEPASGQPSYNLLKMVQPELLPNIRMMIQSAKKQNSSAYSGGLSFKAHGQRKKVNIEVIPLNPLSTPKERQFLVLFEDPTRSLRPQVKGNRGLKNPKSKSIKGQKISDLRDQIIAQQQLELDSTREYQQTLAEEYESAQEDLVSANEELQSSNEELQSINEELETAKEELQATNEELTTLNEELESRNQDLLRESAHVQIFEAVTVAANDATSVNEALQIFLNHTCLHAGWTVGHSFLLSEDCEFESIDIWHFDDPKKYVKLRSATQNLKLSIKSTLVSRILATRKPVLIMDIERDPGFPRAELAVEAGLKSAFGFPVLVDQTVTAILEYFASRPIEPNDRFIEVMTHMSSQLGRVIERKRDFEISRDREAQKSAILTAALDCIISIDHEGKIREFNPAAENTFGYKRSEVLGRDMSEIIIPPRLRERHKKGLARLLTTGEGPIIDTRLELVGMRRDGSEFPVELTITRLKIDPPMFTGFLRDISDRKQSDERLHQVIESAPNGLMMVDQNGDIVLCNAEIESLFGYQRKELLGKKIGILIPDRDRQKGHKLWDDFFLNPVKGQVGVDRELTGLRKDGTEFPVEIGLSPMNTSEGQFVLASIIDITDRQRIARDLVATKEAAESANIAKSAFLANMSHEIRTPLGAVLGFADLVIDPQVLPSEKAHFVAAIKRNGDLLSNIINDILDLSKIEAGKMQIVTQEVALSEILNDTKILLDLQANDKGISLLFNVDKNAPEILKTDPLRLRQILINIIGNAIKFTSKGTVDVNIRLESPQSNQNCLTFIVNDTGCGISPDQVGKLFTPFSQADATSKRQFGGTGLGLVLSKRFANLLGGDVVLTETTLNKGSSFTITIDPGPIQTLQVEVRKPKQVDGQSGATIRLDGIKVLLAEDAPDNQMLVTRLLKLAGATVDVASNGREAIIKAKEDHYDVLLMDLQMPGMDGFEATMELRKDGYRGKIVALTAHALNDDRDRCLQSGFDDHISKPVNRDILVERVYHCSIPKNSQ